MFGCVTQQSRYGTQSFSSQPSCSSIHTWNELYACQREANTGNASAAVKVAEIYESGSNLYVGDTLLTQLRNHVEDIKISELRRLDRDIKEAFRWWVKAADLGNSQALRKVSDEYYNGYNIAKNKALSEKYLEAAADRGSEWALLVRASKLEETDPVEAGDIYLHLARKNNCFAQKRLSVAYLEGDILKRNPTQAYFWSLLSGVGGVHRESDFHPLASYKVKGVYPPHKEIFSSSYFDAANIRCYVLISTVQSQLEKKLPQIYIRQAQNAANAWKVDEVEMLLDLPPAHVVATIVDKEKKKSSTPDTVEFYSLTTPPKEKRASDSKEYQSKKSEGKILEHKFPRFPILVDFSHKDIQPDDVAVIIGNANYRESKDIPDVMPAYADAAGMKRYARKALGIQEKNIILIEDASLSDMVSTFGSSDNHKGKLYRYLTAGNSRVFIYYSGHGAPGNEDTNYLVPVDAEASMIELNGYPLKVLYKNLSLLPAKSVTVVLEACFSGASQEGTVLINASPVYLNAKETGIPTKLTVITAGTSSQIASWEKDKSHGLFTKYFLKGMSGEADTNRDQNVSKDELESFLGETVTKMALRLYGRNQTPRVVFGN